MISKAPPPPDVVYASYHTDTSCFMQLSCNIEISASTPLSHTRNRNEINISRSVTGTGSSCMTLHGNIQYVMTYVLHFTRLIYRYHHYKRGNTCNINIPLDHSTTVPQHQPVSTRDQSSIISGSVISQSARSNSCPVQPVTSLARFCQIHHGEGHRGRGGEVSVLMKS